MSDAHVHTYVVKVSRTMHGHTMIRPAGSCPLNRKTFGPSASLKKCN